VSRYELYVEYIYAFLCGCYCVEVFVECVSNPGLEAGKPDSAPSLPVQFVRRFMLLRTPWVRKSSRKAALA
jgi:hypothetical protein